MSRVKVYGILDTTDADRELRRIGDGPDALTHLRFEAILTDQFQVTQQAVHIITGSLKASGTHEGIPGDDGAWQGRIRYGGEPPYQTAPSPGPARDAGAYAQMEQARGIAWNDYDYDTDTYGNHNWMAALNFGYGQDQYEEAILAFLRGEA